MSYRKIARSDAETDARLIGRAQSTRRNEPTRSRVLRSVLRHDHVAQMVANLAASSDVSRDASHVLAAPLQLVLPPDLLRDPLVIAMPSHQRPRLPLSMNARAVTGMIAAHSSSI